MIKILMVCHGNICRSPMAEFVMKDMVNKRGLTDRFYIASAATSTDEIGSGVHRGTRQKLSAEGIPMEDHRARQLTSRDYNEYDYFIGMDSANIRNMKRILNGDSENKISRLLDRTDCVGDIADPWYTGNFDQTYKDVVLGCEALLLHLKP